MLEAWRRFRRWSFADLLGKSHWPLLLLGLWGILGYSAFRLFSAFYGYEAVATLLLVQSLAAIGTGAGMTAVLFAAHGWAEVHRSPGDTLAWVAPIDWLHRFAAQTLKAGFSATLLFFAVYLPFVVAAYAAGRWPTTLPIVFILGALPVAIMIPALGALVGLALARAPDGPLARWVYRLAALAFIVLVALRLRTGTVAALVASPSSIDPLRILDVLSFPGLRYLPFHWWAEALVVTRHGVSWAALGALTGVAILASVSAAILQVRSLRNRRPRTASRAVQPGPARATSLLRFASQVLTRATDPLTAEFVRKDLRRIFRTRQERIHWLLAATSLGLELANLTALPRPASADLANSVTHILLLLHLGFLAVLLAVLASRFVLPLLSLERPLLPLLAGPIEHRRIPRAHALTALTILLPAALVIAMSGAFAMSLPPAEVALTMAIAVLFAWAASYQAVWFGTRFPRFDVRGPAEYANSPIGIVYTLAIVAQAFVVLLALAPLLFFVLGTVSGDHAWSTVRCLATLAAAFALVGLLTTAAKLHVRKASPRAFAAAAGALRDTR